MEIFRGDGLDVNEGTALVHNIPPNKDTRNPNDPQRNYDEWDIDIYIFFQNAIESETLCMVSH